MLCRAEREKLDAYLKYRRERRKIRVFQELLAKDPTGGGAGDEKYAVSK
jgi:hypothetical protein